MRLYEDESYEDEFSDFVERSDTHHRTTRMSDGFRKGSTHQRATGSCWRFVRSFIC